MPDRSLVSTLASDNVLDAAYAWLCQRRKGYPPNADVWCFRHDWQAEKPSIQGALLRGAYCFYPLQRVTLASGDEIDLWSARDALVLKALTMVLSDVLPVSRLCTHVKGHGGAKSAVGTVFSRLDHNRFVLRTDVKSYYASIDHHVLLDQLAVHVTDRIVLNLLAQYLKRTSEFGGTFVSYERGISLGCPLSPLIGAFFLKPLDDAMERSGLFYVRFMDDILVLAQSRWAIRRAMRTVTHWLNALRLDKHPDKTFIGRIARGFDFLGYHFWPDRLTVAAKTVQAFQDKVSRLYEQNGGSVGVPAAVETYVRRWNAWAKGGLGYVAGRSAVALQGAVAGVVGRASPQSLLKAGRGL